MMKNLTVSLLTILFCSVFSVASGEPIKVVATTGMIADLAQVIGGDYAQVTTLMGPGVDPHLYKAKESDIRAMAEADLILYNGLNLEGKLGDILVKMARRKPVYAVTDEIDREELLTPPEMEGHYDPHLWFDAELWRGVAERVLEIYIEVSPRRETLFRTNSDGFFRDINELHDWTTEQIGSIPKERRVLVTAHDAFRYFGRAYGIEVAAIQGISTEDEASVAEINALVEMLVTRGIKAVFVESTVPRKNIEALIEGCKAQDHEVTVGGELFSDAMGAAGTQEGTYLGMFKHNVETIVTALK